MKTIRVVVVEDSPMMRGYLANSIGRAEGFEVVATAHNAADALEKINAEGPDVVTLDVELPDMNGLELLKRIMAGRAPAVVMVSGLTQSGSQIALRALQLGAVDFFAKLAANSSADRETWTSELICKLRRAAALHPVKFVPPIRGCVQEPSHCEPALAIARQSLQDKLVVVGVGSAATDSLNRFVLQLPRDCYPILVAQQLSPVLIDALVSMLRRRANVEIKIAADGDILTPGCVHLGPGDTHVSIATNGRERCVKLKPGEPIRGYMPCIDLLFEAASRQLGSDAIGILLDGASDDGEAGLKHLVANSARVMRQARDLRLTTEPLTAQSRWGGDIPQFSVERIVESIGR